MEGEWADPGDEGRAGHGPPSVLSSASSAAVSVASSSLSFGFSSNFPSSSAVPVASTSSLMMMMESEPTKAIRSLTAPNGELLRVETAQVVPGAVRSAINVAGNSNLAKFVSSPMCAVCLRHIALTQARMMHMHGSFCTCPGSGRPPGSHSVQSRPSTYTSTSTAESSYTATTPPPSPMQVLSLHALADPLQAPVRVQPLLVSPLSTIVSPVSTTSTCAISPPSAAPSPPLDIPPALSQPSQVAQPSTQPLLSKPPSSTPTPTSSTAHSLPSLDVIFGSSCSTLQHVLKRARDSWAGLVRDVFSTVCRDPSNLVAWRKVFMLPRCILANLARGGRSHWRDTLNLVRARVRKCKADQIPDLWADVMTATDVHACRRKKTKNLPLEQLRKANARRAKRAIENGQYRKAIQALSSDGVAQATPDVRKEMLAKHPQVPPPTIPPDPTPTPVSLTEFDVLKAMSSFPGYSATGPLASEQTTSKKHCRILTLTVPPMPPVLSLGWLS